MSKNGKGKGIDVNLICELRQAGASLQQIADKIGRSKERVRQILVKNHGSTKHELFSTQQLYKLLGLPRNQILELYKDGVIVPAVTWVTGSHHYLLWDNRVEAQIESHYNKHRLCKICNRVIGKGRWIYCSKECYKEGQKRRYKDPAVRQRQLLSVRKYMDKRKQAALAAKAANTPVALPAPVFVVHTVVSSERSYAAVS